MIKNWLSALAGSCTRHRDHSAYMLFGREFGRQVLTGSASAISIRVTRLDHETVDHQVNVIPSEFLARQLFNSSNVFRCKIGRISMTTLPSLVSNKACFQDPQPLAPIVVARRTNAYRPQCCSFKHSSPSNCQRPPRRVIRYLAHSTQRTSRYRQFRLRIPTLPRRIEVFRRGCRCVTPARGNTAETPRSLSGWIDTVARFHHCRILFRRFV